MSDENPGPGESDDGMGKSTRIGTAERDEAVAQLAEHWHAGRLDPAEHELRVTRARAAVTRSDLDALFADLPHAAPAPASTGPVVAIGGQGFLASKRDTIIALTPLAATALFFATGYNWMWFLAVPAMGILLYGPGGRREHHRKR